MREVAEELGVCTDTIRNWLKASGIQPKETKRQNRIERRQQNLEAEIRSLRKQPGAERRDPKKIRRHIFQTIEDKYKFIQSASAGVSVDQLCRLLEISRQRLLRLASSGHQPQKTAGSAAVLSTHYPASAAASLRAGHPISHDP